MTEPRLITPDVVEQACINLIAAAHRSHLAKLERQLSLEPETIERLNTIDLLQDDESLSETVMPAVRLGITELADTPVGYQQGPLRVLAFPWQLQVDILAMGQGYSDGMQRVRWLAMVVIEILVQRLAATVALVESVEIVPPLLFEIVEDSGALGHAELTFNVLVPDAVTVTGAMPLPEEPYEEPAPWPDEYTITADVDRIPIVEE